MSIHLKTMLESAKRAASAAQDAANDCQQAVEASRREAEDIGSLASEASTQVVQAQERVKTIEAKLTAARVSD
jgi:predicted  nucleic acid-binding Zn-ribbon protein|tara:strand:+ start:189 stop:407 length:219 start_codon:yes stop_codon:yes gene_type:complete